MEEFAKEFTELCQKHKIYIWTDGSNEAIRIDPLDLSVKYNIVKSKYNFLIEEFTQC